MYILYHKELYVVKEELTRNRTCQSWRGKQLAMCKDMEPLQEYINAQRDPERYYIEKQPERD